MPLPPDLLSLTSTSQNKNNPYSLLDLNRFHNSTIASQSIFFFYVSFNLFFCLLLSLPHSSFVLIPHLTSPLSRKPDLGGPPPHVSPTSASSKPAVTLACKRPALPAKEYEEAADQLSLTSAYDYAAMTAWLSHPVKKSRPNEGGRTVPLQPMYRRRSQHNIFAPVGLELATKLQPESKLQAEQLAATVKLEPKPLTNGVMKEEVKKEPMEEGEKGGVSADLGHMLLSEEGLKPSFSDLDNMFEDSDTDMGCVPTPPASVQPHISPDEESYGTKLVKSRDPPGNLPSDQLHQVSPLIIPIPTPSSLIPLLPPSPPSPSSPHTPPLQMFPTPPSHEHPSLHSPGEGDEPRTPGSSHIKQEPVSPPGHYGGPGGHYEPSHSSIQPDVDAYFDHTVGNYFYILYFY